MRIRDGTYRKLFLIYKECFSKQKIVLQHVLQMYRFFLKVDMKYICNVFDVCLL